MSHNSELQMCLRVAKKLSRNDPYTPSPTILNYHILQFPRTLVAFVPFKPIYTQISNNMIKLTLQA